MQIKILVNKPQITDKIRSKTDDLFFLLAAQTHNVHITGGKSSALDLLLLCLLEKSKVTNVLASASSSDNCQNVLRRIVLRACFTMTVTPKAFRRKLERADMLLIPGSASTPTISFSSDISNVI